MPLSNIENPARCLALAVIEQAIQDRAWLWVIGSSESLHFWCDAAAVNRECLAKAVITNHMPKDWSLLGWGQDAF